MALNLLKNGVIGAVPVVGDVYSFHFKSNVMNSALIIRAVKHNQDGTCKLTCDPIAVRGSGRGYGTEVIFSQLHDANFRSHRPASLKGE